MLAWMYFIILSVFAWGPSFYFIKISLNELEPLNIAAWRFSLGFIVLVLITFFSKTQFPSSLKSIIHLIILGVINTALPLTLITIAIDRVDSVLAGAIHGSIPIFTMLISAIVITDEKLTPQKVLGCTLGFIGLMILISENNNLLAVNISSHWYGVLIMLSAAISNALGAVYSRITMANVHPLCLATSSMAVATVFLWATVGLSAEDFTYPQQFSTQISLFWMGAIGSALAYYLFFYLIQAWGASKATMVAYVIPVVAILAGVILLDEILTWRIAIGASLILLGVYAAIHMKKLNIFKRA